MPLRRKARALRLLTQVSDEREPRDAVWPGCFGGVSILSRGRLSPHDRVPPEQVSAEARARQQAPRGRFNCSESVGRIFHGRSVLVKAPAGRRESTDRNAQETQRPIANAGFPCESDHDKGAARRNELTETNE